MENSAAGSHNRILVNVACNFVRHRVHAGEIEAQVCKYLNDAPSSIFLSHTEGACNLFILDVVPSWQPYGLCKKKSFFVSSLTGSSKKRSFGMSQLGSRSWEIHADEARYTECASVDLMLEGMDVVDAAEDTDALEVEDSLNFQRNASSSYEAIVSLSM
jgi:hypothetical protein